MNVVTWATRVVGKRLTAPGGLGGQCVDLCNVYLLARGLSAVRRNASGWWLPGAVEGCEWEPNGPLNAPACGDIVVWRGNVPARLIGPDGHVAIALAADGATLLTLDQNWAGATVAALEWHDYVGVAGWWHPRG